MLYPVDWFSGVSQLRPKLHSAASAGRYHDELDEDQIADVFREFARLVDPLNVGRGWAASIEDRVVEHGHLEDYIREALKDEIYSHRTGPGPATSTLYLLADDLDPELSLEDVRRRQWLRSANRHRERGDDREADRLLACMRRELSEP